MSKKISKNSKSNSEKNKHFKIDFIYLFVTCGLIFFPPFFRGLFFESEFNIVHIISFAVILSWLILKYRDRSYSLIQFKYEYFLLAFVAMYFITIPFAASQRAALAEALRYANYFAVYILVRDLARGNKGNMKILTNTIVAGVFGLSLIGLMNYLGFMNNNGALVGNRIYSTLQYPNTLAAVIGAAVFITLSLLLTSNIKLKFVYTGVLNILFITFILTFSRTMWLLLPVIFIAYIFIVSQDKRFEVILFLLSTLLPSVAAAGMLTAYMGEKSFISMGIILISALISIALVTVISKLKLGTFSNKVFGSIVIGIIILFGIAGIAAVNTTQPVTLSHYNDENGYVSFGKSVYSVEGKGDFLLKLDAKTEQLEKKPWLGRIKITSIDNGWGNKTIKDYYIREETDGIVEIPFSTNSNTYYISVNFYNYYKDTSFTIRNVQIIDTPAGNVLSNVKLDYKYLPRAFSSRLESINPKASSMQGRLAFFRDAFKLIKDNMIIGLGGGAWEASYMAYRSYEYWSTETHSYPIQVWIETGTLGFLLLMGFLAFYFANIYKSYRNTDESVNSKIRFLGILFFILTLLAHSLVDFDLSLGAVSIFLWTLIALTTRYFEGIEVSMKKANYSKAIFIILSGFLLFTSTSFTLAAHFNNKTVSAVSNNKLSEAGEHIAIAAKLDPLNPDYRVNMAKIINARKDIESQTKYERSVMQLERAINSDKYNYQLYIEMALNQFRYGHFDLAMEYIDKSIHYNPAVARTYIQKADFLYNCAKYRYMKGKHNEAINYLKEIGNIERLIAEKNEQLERPIKIKPALLEQIYKANFVLDNITDRRIFNKADSVVMYENFDFDTDSDLLPDLWQIPDQADKVVEGCITQENDGEAFRITSDNPSFFTQRFNLSLEASSRYLVVVEGKSKSDIGKMTVLLGSSSGKREQFKEGNIALSEEYSVYQNTFETSDDIEPGNQYIRLYFNGKGKEVFIKKIFIARIN